MLNRTLLLKTSKILLNIRVTDIPLNYLEKKNIRTFLIISCQQGIDCFLYQNVSRKILNNWNITIPSLRTSKELELSNLLIIPKLRHGEAHYIPQVVKEERETTKLRTVYDASANQNGPSINESLHSGPSLLPKIFDIPVRFRSYKYANRSYI